jgi:hypothetical protein
MGGLEKLVSLSAKTGINAYVLTSQIKSQLRGACYAFMVVLKRGTEAVVRPNYQSIHGISSGGPGDDPVDPDRGNEAR